VGGAVVGGFSINYGEGPFPPEFVAGFVAVGSAIGFAIGMVAPDTRLSSACPSGERNRSIQQASHLRRREARGYDNQYMN
jgi:hypothetical protein